MHVIYSINKAASIYSSIDFGYSVAGSFGGQVGFESESELKFFTMNLYHPQFSRTIHFFVLLLLLEICLSPKFFGPLSFFCYQIFWSSSFLVLQLFGPAAMIAAAMIWRTGRASFQAPLWWEKTYFGKEFVGLKNVRETEKRSKRLLSSHDIFWKKISFSEKKLEFECVIHGGI